MPVSEARIRANQINSTRSTGPRTAEGKERSRRNGMKHGMTGQGVVIPDSEAAEVERREGVIRAEMDPQSAIGEILILQMATLSVRMERGARQELAAVAARVRHAADEYDEGLADEAKQLLETIGDDPRDRLRRLRKSPEGVDLLIQTWRDLRADLTREPQWRWPTSHLLQSLSLLGIKAENSQGTRIVALSRAAGGIFEFLDDHEGGDLDRDSRKAWARARIVEWIDREIAELEAHRESLDVDSFDRDRAEAGDRALFDPSREATLARRYESEARRGFFRALKEFRQAEAEVARHREAVTPTTVTPVLAPPQARLASSWEGPPSVHRSPTTIRREVPLTRPRPLAMDFDVARGPDGGPIAIGRSARVPASSA